MYFHQKILNNTFKTKNICFRSIVDSAKKSKPFSEVPGPRNIPLLGNFLGFTHPEFGRNPKYAIQTREYMHKKYGSLVRMEFPGNIRPPMLFIFDPDMSEKCYRTSGPQPIRSGAGFFEAAQAEFHSTKGLLVSQKSEWWNLRSRIQQPLLRPKNLLRYIEPLEDIAMEFIDKKVRKYNGNDVDDNFVEDMYKWALEDVGRIAFNKKLSCLDENLSKNSEQVILINAVNKGPV